jgi:hypothetical protein
MFRDTARVTTAISSRVHDMLGPRLTSRLFTRGPLDRAETFSGGARGFARGTA